MKPWLLQFASVSILLLLVWAFLNTPDDRILTLALSVVLALAAFATACWIVTNNFTGVVRPQPTKLARVAGCLVAMLLLLWLLGVFENSSMPATISQWITSAVALKLKKPLTPDRAEKWVEAIVFLTRWIAIPLLVVPLIAKTVRYRRVVLIYLAAFLVGGVLPHYLIHWVPKLHGFGPQVLSAASRFLLAYLILITAWVLLGRSVRSVART